jgi:hypothetical protein
MGRCGDSGRPPALLRVDESRARGLLTGRRPGHAWAKIPRGAALLAVLTCASALASCGGNFDGGQLLIDPGRYEMFKCDDLAKRWKAVSAREKQLRELMARASQTSGGAVVGALTYRADYDAVVSDEKLLQHEAAAKNCALSFEPGGAVQAGQAPPGQPVAGPAPGGPQQNTVYQSDQGIR